MEFYETPEGKRVAEKRRKDRLFWEQYCQIHRKKPREVCVLITPRGIRVIV